MESYDDYKLMWWFKKYRQIKIDKQNYREIIKFRNQKFNEDEIRTKVQYRDNHELELMMEDEAEWLSTFIPDSNITKDNFFDTLQDGVILCKLANTIQDYAYRKANETNTKSFGHYINYQTKSKLMKDNTSKFVWRENVFKFLNWCISHRIPKPMLFESNDCVEPNREGRREIVICLMNLARKFNEYYNIPTPMMIQVENIVDNDIATYDSSQSEAILPVYDIYDDDYSINNEQIPTISGTKDLQINYNIHYNENIGRMIEYHPLTLDSINTINNNNEMLKQMHHFMYNIHWPSTIPLQDLIISETIHKNQIYSPLYTIDINLMPYDNDKINFSALTPNIDTYQLTNTNICGGLNYTIFVDISILKSIEIDMNQQTYTLSNLYRYLKSILTQNIYIQSPDDTTYIRTKSPITLKNISTNSYETKSYWDTTISSTTITHSYAETTNSINQQLIQSDNNKYMDDTTYNIIENYDTTSNELTNNSNRERGVCGVTSGFRGESRLMGHDRISPTKFYSTYMSPYQLEEIGSEFKFKYSQHPYSVDKTLEEELEINNETISDRYKSNEIDKCLQYAIMDIPMININDSIFYDNYNLFFNNSIGIINLQTNESLSYDGYDREIKQSEFLDETFQPQDIQIQSTTPVAKVTTDNLETDNLTTRSISTQLEDSINIQGESNRIYNENVISSTAEESSHIQTSYNQQSSQNIVNKSEKRFYATKNYNTTDEIIVKIEKADKGSTIESNLNSSSYITDSISNNLSKSKITQKTGINIDKKSSVTDTSLLTTTHISSSTFTNEKIDIHTKTIHSGGSIQTKSVSSENRNNRLNIVMSPSYSKNNDMIIKSRDQQESSEIKHKITEVESKSYDHGHENITIETSDKNVNDLKMLDTRSESTFTKILSNDIDQSFESIQSTNVCNEKDSKMVETITNDILDRLGEQIKENDSLLNISYKSYYDKSDEQKTTSFMPIQPNPFDSDSLSTFGSSSYQTSSNKVDEISKDSVLRTAVDVDTDADADSSIRSGKDIDSQIHKHHLENITSITDPSTLSLDETTQHVIDVDNQSSDYKLRHLSKSTESSQNVSSKTVYNTVSETSTSVLTQTKYFTTVKESKIVSKIQKVNKKINVTDVEHIGETIHHDEKIDTEHISIVPSIEILTKDEDGSNASHKVETRTSVEVVTNESTTTHNEINEFGESIVKTSHQVAPTIQSDISAQKGTHITNEHNISSEKKILIEDENLVDDYSMEVPSNIIDGKEAILEELGPTIIKSPISSPKMEENKISYDDRDTEKEYEEPQIQTQPSGHSLLSDIDYSSLIQIHSIINEDQPDKNINEFTCEEQTETVSNDETYKFKDNKRTCDDIMHISVDNSDRKKDILSKDLKFDSSSEIYNIASEYNGVSESLNFDEYEPIKTGNNDELKQPYNSAGLFNIMDGEGISEQTKKIISYELNKKIDKNKSDDRNQNNDDIKSAQFCPYNNYTISINDEMTNNESKNINSREDYGVDDKNVVWFDLAKIMDDSTNYSLMNDVTDGYQNEFEIFNFSNDYTITSDEIIHPLELTVEIDDSLMMSSEKDDENESPFIAAMVESLIPHQEYQTEVNTIHSKIHDDPPNYDLFDDNDNNTVYIIEDDTYKNENFTTLLEAMVSHECDDFVTIAGDLIEPKFVAAIEEKIQKYGLFNIKNKHNISPSDGDKPTTGFSVIDENKDDYDKFNYAIIDDIAQTESTILSDIKDVSNIDDFQGMEDDNENRLSVIGETYMDLNIHSNYNDEVFEIISTDDHDEERGKNKIIDDNIKYAIDEQFLGVKNDCITYNSSSQNMSLNFECEDITIEKKHDIISGVINDIPESKGMDDNIELQYIDHTGFLQIIYDPETNDKLGSDDLTTNDLDQFFADEIMTPGGIIDYCDEGLDYSDIKHELDLAGGNECGDTNVANDLIYGIESEYCTGDYLFQNLDQSLLTIEFEAKDAPENIKLLDIGFDHESIKHSSCENLDQIDIKTNEVGVDYETSVTKAIINQNNETIIGTVFEEVLVDSPINIHASSTDLSLDDSATTISYEASSMTTTNLHQLSDVKSYDQELKDIDQNRTKIISTAKDEKTTVDAIETYVNESSVVVDKDEEITTIEMNHDLHNKEDIIDLRTSNITNMEEEKIGDLMSGNVTEITKNESMRKYIETTQMEDDYEDVNDITRLVRADKTVDSYAEGTISHETFDGVGTLTTRKSDIVTCHEIDNTINHETEQVTDLSADNLTHTIENKVDSMEPKSITTSKSEYITTVKNIDTKQKTTKNITNIKIPGVGEYKEEDIPRTKHDDATYNTTVEFECLPTNEMDNISPNKLDDKDIDKIENVISVKKEDVMQTDVDRTIKTEMRDLSAFNLKEGTSIETDNIENIKGDDNEDIKYLKRDETLETKSDTTTGICEEVENIETKYVTTTKSEYITSVQSVDISNITTKNITNTKINGVDEHDEVNIPDVKLEDSAHDTPIKMESRQIIDPVITTTNELDGTNLGKVENVISVKKEDVMQTDVDRTIKTEMRDLSALNLKESTSMETDNIENIKGDDNEDIKYLKREETLETKSDMTFGMCEEVENIETKHVTTTKSEYVTTTKRENITLLKADDITSIKSSTTNEETIEKPQQQQKKLETSDENYETLVKTTSNHVEETTTLNIQNKREENLAVVETSENTEFENYDYLNLHKIYDQRFELSKFTSQEKINDDANIKISNDEANKDDRAINFNNYTDTSAQIKDTGQSEINYSLGAESLTFPKFESGDFTDVRHDSSHDQTINIFWSTPIKEYTEDDKSKLELCKKMLSFDEECYDYNSDNINKSHVQNISVTEAFRGTSGTKFLIDQEQELLAVETNENGLLHVDIQNSIEKSYLSKDTLNEMILKDSTTEDHIIGNELMNIPCEGNCNYFDSGEIGLNLNSSDLILYSDDNLPMLPSSVCRVILHSRGNMTDNLLSDEIQYYQLLNKSYNDSIVELDDDDKSPVDVAMSDKRTSPALPDNYGLISSHPYYQGLKPDIMDVHVDTNVNGPEVMNVPNDDKNKTNISDVIKIDDIDNASLNRLLDVHIDNDSIGGSYPTTDTHDDNYYLKDQQISMGYDMIIDRVKTELQRTDITLDYDINVNIEEKNLNENKTISTVDTSNYEALKPDELLKDILDNVRTTVDPIVLTVYNKDYVDKHQETQLDEQDHSISLHNEDVLSTIRTDEFKELAIKNIKEDTTQEYVPLSNVIDHDITRKSYKMDHRGATSKLGWGYSHGYVKKSTSKPKRISSTQKPRNVGKEIETNEMLKKYNQLRLSMSHDTQINRKRSNTDYQLKQSTKRRETTKKFVKDQNITIPEKKLSRLLRKPDHNKISVLKIYKKRCYHAIEDRLVRFNRRAIFVRKIRNTYLVRIGGGWEYLNSFLAKQRNHKDIDSFKVELNELFLTPKPNPKYL